MPRQSSVVPVHRGTSIWTRVVRSRRSSVMGAPRSRARTSEGDDDWDRPRSEERRVGKECVVRVDLGGSRIIKTKQDTIDAPTTKQPITSNYPYDNYNQT